MLKIGLIGLGAIYSIHKKAILETDYAKITALCDTDTTVLHNETDALSCRGYTDYREMLSNETLDIVHICTPHYLHAEMAIDALSHGMHVFLEKPVGMYGAQGDAIKEAEQKNGKTVCVALQNRYNETTKKIKEVIASKTLGKVIGIRSVLTWKRTGDYYTDSSWRGKIEKEGGALLMNQAVHTLDLMSYFAQSPVKSVRAHIANRGNIDIINEEDTAEVYIEYENGVKGIFFGTNAFTRNEPHIMDIHLEHGSLSLYKNKLYIEKNGETMLAATDDNIQGEKSYWGLGHKFLIADFYQYLLGNGGSYIDVQEGINALKLCDSIYRASAIEKN